MTSNNHPLNEFKTLTANTEFIESTPHTRVLISTFILAQTQYNDLYYMTKWHN